VASVFVRGRLSIALFTKIRFIASVLVGGCRACRDIIALGYLALCQVLFLPLPKDKFCVKVWRVGGCVFFRHRSGLRAGCLTKRAPDVWESARFTGIFLASSFSYISGIVHARPHAGNANR
jgi:hypothetical protein